MKRFGVDNSILLQLKQFQLRAKHRRSKMGSVFNVLVKSKYVVEGEPMEVIVSHRTISITPFEPPIEAFRLQRQQPVFIDGWTVQLNIGKHIQLQFQFNTANERDLFLYALGDLNDPSDDQADEDVHQDKGQDDN